jgi:hypothetical protein
MNTSLIPKTMLPAEAKLDWQFLGGLIDLRDLEGGSFEIYTNLQSFQAFRLRKDRVGFEGGIGLKTYERSTRYPTVNPCLELVLWPHMPATDTRRGYVDVFDPKPRLKLVWQFDRHEQEGMYLERIEAEFKTDKLYLKSAKYALKLLQRAYKLWPQANKD